MSKNIIAPPVRFQGFTEPWEQRKLGELLIERIEKSPKSDKYPLMAFIANQGVAPKGDRYDRSALVNDTENKLYKRTELGDFIYSSNNLETGSIGLNKYGNATISPVYSVFKSTRIADSDFIGRRLVRKDFINEMVKWRQGVIYGQWKIHEEDFLKIDVIVPLLDEQREIGSFLDCLDNLITLHQHKLELQKKLKAFFLKNMFPEEGETVPRIRFKGFTGDWEQRKLNDLVTIRRGLTYKPSDIAENGIRVLRASNIDEDQFITSNDDVFVNIEAVNIPFAKNGDILITSANGSKRLVGKHTIISDIAENSAVHGGFMLLAESNNPLFTDALLSSNWYKRFINTYVAGGNGAIGNLSKSDLESQIVMIPSEHEQAKIGQWYDNINQLITLHQRKIDQLQTVKKFMLQNLFI